jgi:hypothetical protein
MHKFVIEREIPAIGAAEPEEMRAVAQRANELIGTCRSDVQWVQSYVAADKMYCVYLATGEEILRKYLGSSGFPFDQVNEIRSIVDPTTAA